MDNIEEWREVVSDPLFLEKMVRKYSRPGFEVFQREMLTLCWMGS